MKLRGSLLFVLAFVLVLCSIDAKRLFSGSSGRKPSSSSWGSFGRSKPSPVRPSAPTSFHDKSSSSGFIHSESSRPHSVPSYHPPPVRSSSSPSHSAPYPTGTHHTPSAPPSFPTNNRGSGLVHEQHQKSGASLAHNDPYQKQPAYNPHASSSPYVPSGGYNNPTNHLPPPPHGISAPYPSIPNHPLPNPKITSSSYPSNSHSPPISSGPIQSHNYPSTHNSPPSFGPMGYHPSSGGYHPSSGGYNSAPPAYHPAPPAYHPPGYQPATAPFVPGRTVYVMPESSHKSSSGPGLGTYIASGVAGGVAAGATNAIVDHAISAIFRPNSHNVHTYPSAPPVGTPTTVTHITNNYYGPTDGANGTPTANGAPSSNGAPVNSQAAGVAPMSAPDTVGQPAQASPNLQPNLGSTNPGTDGRGGNPSTATNGAASRTPEEQPQNPPPNNDFISDENIMKFTEELFEKQDKNINQYVELNLQKRAANTEEDKPVPDEAPEPLFKLKPELDTIPTITALKALYDNYNRDGSQKENVTPERRTEENHFLDEIVKTPVMSRTIDWLVENKFIESDDYEKKDVLRRMWFNNFGDTSSGFERIFLSEKFDYGILGMQNWLYFAHLESQNNVNYLGYVDQTSLSGKGSLLKLNYITEGFTMRNATIFVGTPPELEMALYTVCFYTRPNNWCPISLGGAKFFIATHSFRYFGKDLIDVGFPTFN